MITLSAFWPVFNRQKPWDTDFTVQSWNEAHKNSAQNYPKIHGQTKGGGAGAVAQSRILWDVWLFCVLQCRIFIGITKLSRNTVSVVTTVVTVTIRVNDCRQQWVAFLVSTSSTRTQRLVKWLASSWIQRGRARTSGQALVFSSAPSFQVHRAIADVLTGLLEPFLFVYCNTSIICVSHA